MPWSFLSLLSSVNSKNELLDYLIYVILLLHSLSSYSPTKLSPKIMYFSVLKPLIDHTVLPFSKKMHLVNKVISVSFGQRVLNVNVLLKSVVIKFHSSVQSKQYKSILNYGKNIIHKK